VNTDIHGYLWSTQMRRIVTLTTTAAVLVAAISWYLYGAQTASAEPAPAENAGPPPAQVTVEPAVARVAPAVATVPGTVVSRNDARVAAEVVGRLAWVAEVGAEVPAGGVLARLDARDFELALRQAEATFNRARSAHELAAAQAKRFAELAASRSVSAQEASEAQLRRDMAQQEMEQSRVARDQAALRLERAQVRAPFAGRVVERLRNPGEYIGAGGEVVRVVDTRHMEVRAQAPLAVAAFVRAGQTVTVSDGQDGGDGEGRRIESRIRAAVPVGDDRSRMMEVRIALEGAPWPVGMPVRVALPQSKPRDAVLVDRDALVVREDGVFVWRVASGDKAERVQVTTGAEQADLVEVMGGIAAGDRVIVRGAERLTPGQPLAVRG
jgi:RND family efflux transporter MFP subunit